MKRLKYNILQITLAIATCAWLVPVVAFSQSMAADSAFYARYPYILFVESGDSISDFGDDAFLDIAAPIIYPVNKYTLPQRDKTFRQIADEVIPRLNRDSMRVRHIVFRGAASPEGPFRWNKFLSEHRAQALSDYMRQHMVYPPAEEYIATHTIAEDYPLLCAMMKRAGDPDYALVRAICDEHYAAGRLATLKRKLQTAKRGELWWRLLKQYYPQLRAARVIIYIEKAVAPEPAQTVEEVEEPEPIVPVDTVAVAPVDTIVETPLPQLPIYRPVEVKLPRREMLSVKTNLLFYGIYMPGYDRYCPIPNIAIEYFPRHGHFTYGASFDMPWWQDYDGHKYFQLRNYQLETRYYLRSGDERLNPPGQGAAFRGLYLQGYVHAGLFGICFDADRGWVGEGVGAGIGAGYVLPLTRKGHWRLEFGLQAGFFTCKYDPYQFENPVNPNYRDGLYYYKWTGKPSAFKKRQYQWSWLGPTRIGITLSYDLLYRRIQKKGISFKSYETEIRHVPAGETIDEE